MFEHLPPAQPDPLFSIVSQFQNDPRPEKMDLIVGVYRDDTGQTPILNSVQQAERVLAEQGASKTYRTPRGNTAFNDGMAKLVLGKGEVLQRQFTIQTVGGTGALRLLAELVSTANPDATVWSTTPGYVNHEPLMRAAGLKFETYRWHMTDGAFDAQAMFDDLRTAKRGDVVIIHGCCHNPSGIDMPIELWADLSEFCLTNGLFPLVDIAYQGFGQGLEEDAEGLRLLARAHPNIMVAASCSKNMSLYCERTGAAMVISDNATELTNAQSCLEHKARANYSMPPEHGAAIATLLMGTPEQWAAEVDQMRNRVQTLRRSLCTAFAQEGLAPEFQDIQKQFGMFSLLPLSAGQMGQLRQDFGIYGLNNGRINIAGLQSQNLPYLVESIKTVSN